MKNTRMRLCFLLALTISLLSITEAQAQFSDSAKWVPDDANCLVMVQSKKIFDSALGKKEKWYNNRSKAFRSGASFFPPTTERMLIASQIDYEFMDSVWHVGVFEKKGTAIDIVEVSKRIKGNIDTIADNDALMLPNNSYLVQIDDKTLVSMTPANRQMTSRWLRKKANGKVDVSPYLAEAIKFADANAQVIVALDLDGVIDAEEIAKRLSEGKVIPESAITIHSKTLASIAGVTLGVTVRDKISGSFKIDFREDPSKLTSLAKPILLAALKKNGMMIDDMQSWAVTREGNQIRLSGPLSSEGLSQVGSLIHQPIVDDLSGASANSGGSSIANEPEVDMATRTKQYFGDVNHVVEMLRRKDVEQLDTYMKWFNRYARQIDSISIRGVDPVMVEYGTYIANSFRDVSGVLSSADLNKNTGVAAQGFSNAGGGRWSYGYGYGTINGRNYARNSRRAASAIGTQKGKDSAGVVIREIEAKTAEVRKAMSVKYDMDF